MRIYLSGPIEGLTSGEARTWREEARRLLPFRVISPLDFSGLAADGKRLREAEFAAIETAQAMLVNLTTPAPMVGTMIEVGYAFARGVPIVTFGELHARHPFFAGVPRFASLSDACRHLGVAFSVAGRAAASTGRPN